MQICVNDISDMMHSIVIADSFLLEIEITITTFIFKAFVIDFLNQCQISFRMSGHSIGFPENADSAKKIQYGGQTGHIEKGKVNFFESS